MESEEADKWAMAIESERDALARNGTWEEVDPCDIPRDSGRRPLRAKFVFKRKFQADGTIQKYEARLVVKGYSQRKGIDYTEVFALVVRVVCDNYRIA